MWLVGGQRGAVEVVWQEWLSVTLGSLPGQPLDSSKKLRPRSIQIIQPSPAISDPVAVHPSIHPTTTRTTSFPQLRRLFCHQRSTMSSSETPAAAEVCIYPSRSHRRQLTTSSFIPQPQHLPPPKQRHQLPQHRQHQHNQNPPPAPAAPPPALPAPPPPPPTSRPSPQPPPSRRAPSLQTRVTTLPWSKPSPTSMPLLCARFWWLPEATWSPPSTPC